ncbi:hypothetical protein BDF19DRAFT_497728 [Syncephalis fuscata]|nr:hypothetical protein BDF19DRAFT_497728 [Syncephalis fuscata]
MGTGNPLGYDFPIGDAYRLYDTANTHTGISDALGGSTAKSTHITAKYRWHHLAMDSSQAAAGGRPRPRPLRSATVSLMNGVAASEFMSITSPALSSSFGGANQGLGEVAIPRTPDFATSPFGGERSFLLSLSYEGRSSESPLSASLQARRNQLRVTNLLTQRGASGTNGDNIDHLGDDVEPGIDRDDGSELGYDDFQPEFFPSSLDELLTPSELEKRRRREHSKMSDELRRGMLGGLSQGFTGETGELQPPVSPTKQPLQHHWRAAAALSPISPFTRGIPMSMPNHSSLSDYDRFDVLHTSMAVGSIGSIGTPAASPGAWNRPDPLLMGSISAAVGSHTTIGPNIQHSMLNNNNNNSNSINNNNTHNNYGDPSLGHSALSPDVTKGNTAFNSLTEPRFSFHLDDDVPFRMDDVPESSPLPSGLSTQTASTIAANHPSANATATNAASGLLSPSSPNELGLSNTIGSPLGSNDLTSRLAGLHLDANGQTASTSLNPWS